MSSGLANIDPSALARHLPEEALHVTGSARLVLVINLGSFVDEANADTFRHLRGSEARRHVREEVPFYTGALVEVADLVARLP